MTSHVFTPLTFSKREKILIFCLFTSFLFFVRWGLLQGVGLWGRWAWNVHTSLGLHKGPKNKIVSLGQKEGHSRLVQLFGFKLSIVVKFIHVITCMVFICSSFTWFKYGSKLAVDRHVNWAGQTQTLSVKPVIWPIKYFLTRWPINDVDNPTD